MIPTGDAEARVRALETAAVRLLARVGRLDADRVPGTEQQLAMLWMVQFQQRVTVRVYGQVEGCGGNALAGTSLKLVGHVTGNDYGTTSLPAGTFDFYLAIDPQDSSTSLDGYTTGPGSSPRWTAGGGPVGVAPNTSTPFPVAAVIASGYTCFGGSLVTQCPAPIANTLHVTDKYGTNAMTYNGSSAWLSSTSINPYYGLSSSGSSFTATYSGTTYFLNGTNSTWSETCADDSTSTKWSLLITVNSNTGPYLAGDTVHVFEP